LCSTILMDHGMHCHFATAICSTCKLAVQEVITQLNFKIHLTRCALFLTLVWLSWRFLDCFLSCHCRKYWRLISVQDLIHWKWSVSHNIAGM
jgi:hypothetical protein